ncbi:GumC family protein [Dyadobacter sandarakinus]|uniref:Polysaccharide biosynthesis tyrosine autokinase n=1 Tax=Dyadobacter sandarakinus TaxID=2747268 RepID=A0ABX7IAU5_9BACT|nr:tyrosine-protein kinase family protein [Dyadobacter sandarakinus]QRR03244.1 polysaccharide biosynthesis tyrosine autokinase [Dyadobacter sandarakinus]
MQEQQQTQVKTQYAFHSGRLLLSAMKSMQVHWRLYLVFTCTSLCLALLYLRYATPRYIITSSILIRDDSRGSEFAESAFMEELGGLPLQSNVDNEIEVLKSRTLMQSVVNDLQLNVRYEVAGDIKTAELHEKSPYRLTLLDSGDQYKATSYQITELHGRRFRLLSPVRQVTGRFGDTIRLGSGRAVLRKTSFKPGEQCMYSITLSPHHTIVNQYASRLKVTASNKLASIVTLSLTDILPEKGEAILNKLLDNYQKINAAEQSRRAAKTLAFIEQHLVVISARLQKDEVAIQKFKSRHQLTDITEHAKLLTRNRQLTQQEASKYNAQLDVLTHLGTFLVSGPEQTLPASLTLQEPTFAAIISRYNEVLTTKAKYLATTRAGYPRIRELEDQLKSLKADLQVSIQAHRQEISTYLTALRSIRLQEESEMQQLPQWERTYQGLLRQQQTDQELYVLLLKKRLETALSKSSTISNARMIDPPLADPEPTHPDARVTLVMAGFTGLMLPFLLLHLRQALNTRVLCKSDVSERIDLPFIGELTHVSRRRKQLLFAPRSAITEQFRTLRTNLHFLPDVRSRQVILITSGTSHEGKSWIAMNLAETLSRSGRKVVLVEMDLRKPGITTYLDLNPCGVTELLTSGQNPSTFLQKSPGLAFDIIAAGKPPPDPLALLLGEYMGDLFASLKAMYEHIIIDSPPAGLLADALLIGQYSDLSLYVIRQGFTRKSDLDKLCQISARNQLPLLHLILNDVQADSDDQYNYYQQKREGHLKSLLSKYLKYRS